MCYIATSKMVDKRQCCYEQGQFLTVSDCCLTPSEQFISYSRQQQVISQWIDEDVLDQQA